MSPLNNDLVAVLRRRARKLHEDGYDAAFCATLMAAADELAVRRRCETREGAEQEAIDAVNDNRLLGKRLENLARIINDSNMLPAMKAKCGAELRLAGLIARPGQRRRIVALSLEPGTTMAAFMIAAKEQYEKYAVPEPPPGPTEVARETED